MSKEDNQPGFDPSRIRSLIVGANTGVILYSVDGFDNSEKAVYVEGPINVNDLSNYRMEEMIRSLKIFSIDNAPVLANNHVKKWVDPQSVTNRRFNIPNKAFCASNPSNPACMYVDRRSVLESGYDWNATGGTNEHAPPTPPATQSGFIAPVNVIYKKNNYLVIIFLILIVSFMTVQIASYYNLYFWKRKYMV
jgi:hypothetical protein